MLKYRRSTENLTHYRWHFWEVLPIKKLGGTILIFEKIEVLFVLGTEIPSLTRKFVSTCLSEYPTSLNAVDHSKINLFDTIFQKVGEISF